MITVRPVKTGDTSKENLVINITEMYRTSLLVHTTATSNILLYYIVSFTTYFQYKFMLHINAELSIYVDYVLSTRSGNNTFKQYNVKNIEKKTRNKMQKQKDINL